MSQPYNKRSEGRSKSREEKARPRPREGHVSERTAHFSVVFSGIYLGFQALEGPNQKLKPNYIPVPEVSETA